MSSSLPSHSKTTGTPAPLPPSFPPPLIDNKDPCPPPVPKLIVGSEGPQGAYLVELLVYNGYPFKDHWAYFVCSQSNSGVGVLIHAAGDVRSGFRFEIKRSYDLRASGRIPSNRIALQWVNSFYFDETTMFNNGTYKVDTLPVCDFEASMHKAKAPEKTLNSVEDMVRAFLSFFLYPRYFIAGETSAGMKVHQRNCQTWIVESAGFLVQDGIFNPEVAVYLNAIKQ
ncbi:hypothetical protein CPAR01_16738 [Colletotrichum paranaense]|uniref:Uncharacterized protein n=1 Tax=Colletotrichum paranaense TaxID=1914294 RepID=A0ABQ9RW07_9PEZI|nr:uncharacterized protein CPAR01_16738 [Colletotrichum paranaense]KAK1515400.1 hypothetical protein CPAR01_16738 [Colletotrichum paranaense]